MATSDATAAKRSASPPPPPSRADDDDDDDDDDDSYPAFTPHHRSLLRKHLTPEMWNRLRRLRTSRGITIEDVVRPGLLAPPVGSPGPPRRLGVIAGDAECYSAFRELLDPIIREYHGICAWDEDFEEWEDPELPDEGNFFPRKRRGGGGEGRRTTTGGEGGRRRGGGR